MTVRLRATVTVEYDADPEDYGTDAPAAMAAIDEEVWRGNMVRFACSFDADELTIAVRPA